MTEVLKLPFRIGDKDLAITMAAGIAVFPADGSDADALFRNAEAALKRAKSSGEPYSSLRYLAKLPVNAVKIDRSFIITMASDSDSMTIVSTIISLAHSLNLKVIAEGVDAEDQRKLLTLLRCDEMQGYLFSRPVPADDLLALLKAGSTVPA